MTIHIKFVFRKADEKVVRGGVWRCDDECCCKGYTVALHKVIPSFLVDREKDHLRGRFNDSEGLRGCEIYCTVIMGSWFDEKKSGRGY